MYVIGVNGVSGDIAYAIADLSAGFGLPTETPGNPVNQLFVRIAAAAQQAGLDVRRVAIEFRSTSGSRMGVVTASRDDIGALAAGSLTDDEFKKKLVAAGEPSLLLPTT
jgi:hypothetical protein